MDRGALPRGGCSRPFGDPFALSHRAFDAGGLCAPPQTHEPPLSSSQAAGPVLCVRLRPRTSSSRHILARRSSLAVLESSFFPLRGWAAWLGARNLATGEATPKLLATIRDAVERLKYYGNNAFAERFGKDRARSIVGELRGRGDFDRDLVLGAVLAAGVSAHGVKNLAALIDRVR